MRRAPVTAEVRDGRLEVSARQHVDLIGHVFARGSDRELLRELHTRVTEVERGGA